MSKLRVLIVGAGASGLPAVKSCLEDGLEPVCCERSADIGGLWNYDNSLVTEDEIECVMRSTVINTSKEMTCYSDFPVPPEFPNFKYNKFVLQYLRLYVEKFGLMPFICLNTEVYELALCTESLGNETKTNVSANQELCIGLQGL